MSSTQVFMAVKRGDQWVLRSQHDNGDPDERDFLEDNASKTEPPFVTDVLVDGTRKTLTVHPDNVMADAGWVLIDEAYPT